MEKEKQKLEFDDLYRTAREMAVKEGVIDGPYFEKLTQSLGMAKSVKSACRTWQELVQSASPASRSAREQELAETQALYEDTLQSAYNIICESGYKEIYDRIVAEKDEEQNQ